jgi:F-type H+-transporting ATPase subunit b
MPAFFDSAFWNLNQSDFWVGVGLLIFLAILTFAGAPKLIARTLDERADKVRSELEEAQRLRAEAEAMLAQIRAEKLQAEAQARDLVAQAEADARRTAEEARIKLEESLARRQAQAERKIALAESQAVAEVKAAAVELAAQAAERMLADRLRGKRSDPLVDRALPQLHGRFTQA